MRREGQLPGRSTVRSGLRVQCCPILPHGGGMERGRLIAHWPDHEIATAELFLIQAAVKMTCAQSLRSISVLLLSLRWREHAKKMMANIIAHLYSA